MGGYRSATDVRDVPTTDAAAAPGVCGGAADVPGRVEELAAAFVDGADVRSAGSQLVGLRRLIEQLEAVWLSAAADFQRAGGPEQEGAGSMSAWLRRECRMAPGEASARVRVAAAVTGELATTGQALAQGAIGWRHADVIVRTVKDVPHEHRRAAEQLLQEPAKTLDPQYLSRVGQELLHRLDVDKAEQAAVRRLERRGLDIAETLGGMVAVRGLLDPVAGASLLTAVDAKVRRTRGDLEDSRSWSQRRADALAEITDEWLSRGESPQVGGQRPHLSVIVDIESLRKDPGCAAAQLEWVGPITAEQARMLACDASISRIITDGPSRVLDVGRSTRTIPPSIRRAVTVRDGGCVADGCHRPAAQCDVHHVTFWADGGETALHNLVVLCRRHHGFVHQRGWRVVVRDGGERRLVAPTGLPPPGQS
jgi:hypothetical protein